MNDVAPLRPPKDPIGGDRWQASPADQKHLAEHFSMVQAFQAERVHLATRSRRLGWWIAGVAGAIALAEAFSLAVMIPLQRQVPIPIIMHDDGSTQIAWSWRDVLPTNKAAVVTSALWFYVSSREGYNWSDARRNYDAVTAMSGATVRKAYERWFLPGNPDSPQLKVGRHGQVSIQFDGATLAPDVPVARIYFWRILQMDDAQPQKTHWTATLDYRVDEPVSEASRLFNPQGIIVTNYFVQEDTPK